MSGEPLLTAAEVAQQLSVPTSWVEHQARIGGIPSRQIGRYRRFTQADVDEFVEASKAPMTNPLALSARSVANINRSRRRLPHHSRPRQPEAVPAPTRPALAVIVCPAVGRTVTTDSSRSRTVDCPVCARPYCTLQRFDLDMCTGTIARHARAIPVGDLKPEHLLWSGGEQGRQRPAP